MKKSILGLTLLGGLGVGGYFLYKHKQQACGVTNGEQGEKVKRSSKNKQLTPIHDTVNTQIMKDFLIILRETLFDSLQELYYFKQEISPQVKNVPIETLKYTLVQEIQIEELKLFFDKLQIPLSAVVTIPKSKLGYLRNQIFLRRAYKNTLKQLLITENGEKDLQQKLKDNKDSEIEALILEIVKEFQSVLSGGIPSNTIQEKDIPKQLQLQNYIQFQVQLKKAQCAQIQKSFRNNPELIALQGNIQLNSFTVQKILYNIDFSEVYEDILQQFKIKLNKFVYLPKLLDFLTKNFSKQDQQLSDKLKKLDRIYEFAFEACIYEHESQGVIDEIFQRL